MEQRIRDLERAVYLMLVTLFKDDDGSGVRPLTQPEYDELVNLVSRIRVACLSRPEQ